MEGGKEKKGKGKSGTGKKGKGKGSKAAEDVPLTKEQQRLALLEEINQKRRE